MAGEPSPRQAGSQWIRLGEGGRLVVPAEMREALGIEPGDKLLLELDQGVLTVRTFDGAMRRLDELLEPYFPREGSLVDELIRERREEAARE